MKCPDSVQVGRFWIHAVWTGGGCIDLYVTSNMEALSYSRILMEDLAADATGYIDPKPACPLLSRWIKPRLSIPEAYQKAALRAVERTMQLEKQEQLVREGEKQVEEAALLLRKEMRRCQTPPDKGEWCTKRARELLVREWGKLRRGPTSEEEMNRYMDSLQAACEKSAYEEYHKLYEEEL